MFPAQIPVINPDDFSRCEERRQAAEPGKSRSPIQKTDAALKESIYHAFWKDDVLRAIEYDEIDVHVKNGVAYLSGHIVGTSSQSRIINAIRAVPGTLGIQNNLVLDDRLTREVAAALGNLEHTYGCKFFTGASHGVVSIGGIVRDHTVKLLAEQRAASHPNVRGVINHVRVSGDERRLKDQPFLQPTPGETIYFLNGISGIVKQAIIDPDNRRVIAMTIRGNFTDQRYEINSMTEGKTPPPEQLIVVPMSAVRYLTRVSGFLHINSAERNRYTDFNSASFGKPAVAWVPPYPYCPDDVLFPVEQLHMEHLIILQQIPESLIPVASKEQLLWEQLLANDGLGG